MNTKEFILKAKLIHGNNYLYSKTVYSGSQVKVIIICNKCNLEFLQTPNNHTRSKNPCGCPKCSLSKQGVTKIKNAKEEFIYKAQLAHGIGRYDYSESNYTHSKQPVKIFCTFCKEYFLQKPLYHTRSKNPCGCPKCSLIRKTLPIYEKPKEKIKIKKLPVPREVKEKSFIERAIIKHGTNFDYSSVTYIDSKTKINIICNTCNTSFLQTPSNHIHLTNINGCPNCNKPGSILENIITNILDNHNINYETRKTGLLENKRLELDIFLPEYNFAIECHGNFWHSEHILVHERAMNHMKEKLLQCTDKGITLIQLYEDEILNKQDLIEQMILSRLQLLPTMYARKLSKLYFNRKDLTKYDIEKISNFFNMYHLQGISKYNSGCILYDSLTGEYYSIMLFNNITSKRGVSINNSETEIELVRFCSRVNIVGGASKLLTLYLETNQNINKVVSYSDNRISIGNLYQKLGFILENEVKPSYYYVHTKGKSLQRFHKALFKKDSQRSKFKNFNEELTEYENASNNGYKRLWNAGLKKWVFTL